MLRVQLGARHLPVVRRHHRRRQHRQRRARVGDALEARRLHARVRADAVPGRGEHPEPVARVDVRVGDVTSVLGVVDDTKVISTS